MKKWKINKSEYVVTDKYLTLRRDICTTPDGHAIDPYWVFEYRDWVNCFVIDADLNIVMLKHYRHGVQHEVLELVSGGIEESDIAPIDAIKRELMEEIGYIGGEVFQTGISYANPASHTNKIFSFIAFDGESSTNQQLENGETLEIYTLSLKEILNILENANSDEIFQSIHIASIFFALNFIKKSDHSSLKKLMSTI